LIGWLSRTGLSSQHRLFWQQEHGPESTAGGAFERGLRKCRSSTKSQAVRGAFLVATPRLWEKAGSTSEALASLPTLATVDDADEIEWHLEHSTGATHVLRHSPRMSSSDFGGIRQAAVAGLGVALLPEHSCRDHLEAGRLVWISPDWSGHDGIVHLVFTTWHGLLPAVRSFIDRLAATFPPDMVQDSAMGRGASLPGAPSACPGA
jgi:hypothetical protein